MYISVVSSIFHISAYMKYLQAQNSVFCLY